MSLDVRVRLIFDPHGICSAPGTRVADVATERRAFTDIDDLLCRDERYDTVTVKAFIIAPQCADHFRSYLVVKGVAVEHVSPRLRVQQQVGSEPPPWLTDELLLSWRIHERRLGPATVGECWEAIVSEWFAPGLAGTGDLRGWLSTVVEAEQFPIEQVASVRDWVIEQFVALAKDSVAGDTLNILKASLREAESFIGCVREWVRVRALYPLLRHGNDRVLRSPGLAAVSPLVLTTTKVLPLLFPIPVALRHAVSEAYRAAIQQARRDTPDRFTGAALELNAFWDRTAEELSTWLETRPGALTAEVVRHFSALPGYDATPVARRMVELYAPPDTVPRWNGLDERFDAWVQSYSAYVRQVFIRRVLPEREEDPAGAFGRWLKENPTVSFAHQDRGYPTVSRSVNDALKAGRRVVLVVVDALAAHVVAEATSYLSDELQSAPSKVTHIFAPLPTVTEVCKEAIISGRFPSDCTSDLRSTVLDAYGLKPDELVMASSWEDAEQLHITQGTRLLLYRDNRLDAHLKAAGNYRTVLDYCLSIFPRMAKLVARWAEDLRSFARNSPLVLLTADHGFTYGPKPKASVPGAVVLDGHSRCLELPEKATQLPLADESVTVIDKQVFRLRSSYLAARGRAFGEPGAAWVMSHGGLLPEEVIVPVVEWSGSRTVVPWPEVSFPHGAERDQDGWVLRLLLRNEHRTAITGGSLRISVVGSPAAEVAIPRLGSSQERELLLTVQGEDLPPEQAVPLDVVMAIRFPGSGREETDQRQYLVPRLKKLLERTNEQAAFEDMF